MDPAEVPARYRRRLEGLTLSTSAVKIWLGLDVDPRNLADLGYETLWRSSWQPGDPLGDSLGIHLPHVVDPSACPAGTGVVAITCPHPPVGDQDSADDSGTTLRDRLVDTVEQALLPGLSRHIAVESVATPRTFHRYTGAPGGAILGYSHSPQQAGLRRPGARTPIHGLVLSSAWVFPGGGLTATLMAGSLAAREVLGRGGPGRT